MSLFKRIMTAATGSSLPVKSSQGTGFISNILPVADATNANLTLTVAQMAGGMVQFTGFSAGRTVTTPTAAQILAAAPDMDVNDSFSFIVSVVPAYALTWAAGVGVTLAGSATVEASTFSIVTVVKTSATTVTWNVA